MTKNSIIHIYLTLNSKQTARLIKMVKKSGKMGLVATLGKGQRRKMNVSELESLKKLVKGVPDDPFAKPMLKERIRELQKELAKGTKRKKK